MTTKHALIDTLNREEERINVNAALKMRLHNKFTAPTQQRHWIAALLVPASALAIVAFVLRAPPTSTSENGSFLQRAQAAYETTAARMENQGLIQHTRMEILHAERPPIALENWTNADGTLWYDERSQDGIIVDRSLVTDGLTYVTPEVNATERAAEAEYERLGIESEGPRFALQTPQGVSATYHMGDPEDPTVACIAFEWMDDEHFSYQELHNHITDLVWPTANGTRSIDRFTRLLELLADPRIEDLGESTLATGEIVHGYRLMDVDESREFNDFYFDPATYQLVMRQYGDMNNLDTIVTYHFSVNEFVTVDSLPEDFFTPEAHHLEELYIGSHNVQNLPTYTMQEGCYRSVEGVTEPVMLSDDEAAAVWERIHAAQNGTYTP